MIWEALVLLTLEAPDRWLLADNSYRFIITSHMCAVIYDVQCLLYFQILKLTNTRYRSSLYLVKYRLG